MTLSTRPCRPAHPLGRPTSRTRGRTSRSTPRAAASPACCPAGRSRPAPTTSPCSCPPSTPTGSRRGPAPAPVTVRSTTTGGSAPPTPAGSFEDLAAALQPGDARPRHGPGPLDYPRVPARRRPRGARRARPASARPTRRCPPRSRDDLAGLRTPAPTQVGRPIVGLPRYGDAWRADARTHDDLGRRRSTATPAHRGVAGPRPRARHPAPGGAGRRGARRSSARSRRPGSGSATSCSGWRRRARCGDAGCRPDRSERLWLLGPALRRVVTPTGTVAELATADDRALPAGVFSTAARRVLRSGPARATGWRDPRDGIAAAPVLEAANRCRRAAAVRRRRAGCRRLRQRGSTHARRRRAATSRRRSVDTWCSRRRRSPRRTRAGPRSWPRNRDGSSGSARRFRPTAPRRVRGGHGAAGLGRGRPRAKQQRTESPHALGRLRACSDRRCPTGRRADLIDLLTGLGAGHAARRAAGPGRSTSTPWPTGVAAAFDPTVADRGRPCAGARHDRRARPAQPLAPPEVCVGLDRPVWATSKRRSPEWLLPGSARCPRTASSRWRPTRVFVDAFLARAQHPAARPSCAGATSRSPPAARRCAAFWDRADTADRRPRRRHRRHRDLDREPATSATRTTGPPGAGARSRLVVRGQLFLRYPRRSSTCSARARRRADFTATPTPTPPRVLPTFQGRIGADVDVLRLRGLRSRRRRRALARVRGAAGRLPVRQRRRRPPARPATRGRPRRSPTRSAS